MSSQMTLEQLEQQIAQLSVHEQLKLISRISKQLNVDTFYISIHQLSFYTPVYFALPFVLGAKVFIAQPPPSPESCDW